MENAPMNNSNTPKNPSERIKEHESGPVDSTTITEKAENRTAHATFDRTIPAVLSVNGPRQATLEPKLDL